jgi:hypothetical protein
VSATAIGLIVFAGASSAARCSACRCAACFQSI